MVFLATGAQGHAPVDEMFLLQQAVAVETEETKLNDSSHPSRLKNNSVAVAAAVKEAAGNIRQGARKVAQKEEALRKAARHAKHTISEVVQKEEVLRKAAKDATHKMSEVSKKKLKHVQASLSRKKDKLKKPLKKLNKLGHDLKGSKKPLDFVRKTLRDQTPIYGSAEDAAVMVGQSLNEAVVAAVDPNPTPRIHKKTSPFGGKARQKMKATFQKVNDEREANRAKRKEVKELLTKVGDLFVNNDAASREKSPARSQRNAVSTSRKDTANQHKLATLTSSLSTARLAEGMMLHSKSKKKKMFH